MLVIHQDIDFTDGIYKKGKELEMQQEKTSELIVSQFLNDKADNNSNECLYHKVLYWI